MSKNKILLLFGLAYSFFICFLLNIFGYVLSYEQQFYEWKILNMREGKKAVLHQSIFHFCLFSFFLYLHFRTKLSKIHIFSPLKASESQLDQKQIV